MALAPYDSSSLGPSQSAVLDQTLASNVQQTGFDTGQLNKSLQRNNQYYANVAKPQLESSLGATGQYYSSAARGAEDQQKIAYDNSNHDLNAGFARAQMDMQRQQAFAAMGIIL